jgi:transcriptional regulator of NAD metabolism
MVIQVHPFQPMEKKILDGAIALLEAHSEIMKINEPITRSEGNIEQADFQKENGESYDKALEVLRSINTVWTSMHKHPVNG